MTKYTGLSSVRYLHGVGPKRAELFAGLGILTVEDLLYYFPRRYEDRTRFTAIADLKEGEAYTIKAEVFVKGGRAARRRRGFSITEAMVADESGKVRCVWFNQPYLEAYLKAGAELILYGKVGEYAGRLQMENPDFEIISDEKDASLSIGRIVPIYSITRGITQRSLRRLVKDALDETAGRVKDFLPYDIRSRNGLLNLPKSLLNIHFPESLDLQQQAFRRLSFEEFLIFELPLALRKIHRQDQPGIAHAVKGKLAESFIVSLPFELTESQQKVIAEIKADMENPEYHRLRRVTLDAARGCGDRSRLNGDTRRIPGGVFSPHGDFVKAAL
jgi:ATP-dependent DNA helicase RecG